MDSEKAEVLNGAVLTVFSPRDQSIGPGLQLGVCCCWRVKNKEDERIDRVGGGVCVVRLRAPGPANRDDRRVAAVPVTVHLHTQSSMSIHLLPRPMEERVDYTENDAYAFILINPSHSSSPPSPSPSHPHQPPPHPAKPSRATNHPPATREPGNPAPPAPAARGPKRLTSPLVPSHKF